MRLRRRLGAVLFAAVSVAFSDIQPAAAVVEDLPINLASDGATQTLTVGRDTEFRVKLENMLPTARYSVSVEARHPNIDPFSISEFTVGGEALGAGQPAPAVKALRLNPGDPCTGLVKDFVLKVSSAAEESEIGKVVAASLAAAGNCQAQIDSVVTALTQKVVPSTTPAPGREREVVITITREGNPGRQWQLILTHSSQGEWRVSYGFTFVKNQDRRYFSKADTSQAGKFTIVRQDDREDADFIPSIFFSWHGNRRRWGPAFGLGYDLESPALFLGTGWKYRQNVMVTGGLAIHGRQDLKGRYDPNETIAENLGEDQLTERTFTPNIYLGATFRFGANIHAQRSAALAKISAERKKAADEAKKAAEAEKKEEEKRKAALELCEKEHDLVLAQELKECGDDEACVDIAKAKAEKGKAECRKKDAEGILVQAEETPQPASRRASALPVDRPMPREASSRPREILEVPPVPTPAQRRCATPSLAPETRGRNLELVRRFRALNANYSLKDGVIEIPVNFYVIHDGAEGRITRAAIDSQIATLNQVFNPIGFTFTLNLIDGRDNSAWFRMGLGSAEELDAKRELGRTPEQALNLYSCAPPGYLGWATLPVWLADYPDYDGVVISYRSLPGGSEPAFDLGLTAVHEVAHWLGLEHTFNGWDEKTSPEGGCSPPGDSIDDTPYEASPAFGPGVNQPCPRLGSRDTCPLISGKDPIDNYMDYADDRCMLTFTPGQVAWMKEQTALYRPLLLQNATGEIQTFVPLE